MTKKDFELIASVITFSNLYNYSYIKLSYEFAERLASKNPRFNREKFLQACGVYPSVSTISDSEHSREYLQAEKDTFMRDVDSI